MEKKLYERREKNRAKDFVHKLTKEISREFKKYVHGFKDLRKKNMFNCSKEHNRRIAKMNWKMIVSFMSYKSRTVILNPKNSTKRCSRCGKINAPFGALYICSRCGLRINRQLNAAVNLYLQIVVFSKFEALRGAYEELKCVYPDRGGG